MVSSFLMGGEEAGQRIPCARVLQEPDLPPRPSPALFVGGLSPLSRFPQGAGVPWAPTGGSGFPLGLKATGRSKRASKRGGIVFFCLKEEGKVWEALETFWQGKELSEAAQPTRFCPTAARERSPLGFG